MSAQINEVKLDAAVYLVERDPVLRMTVSAALAGLGWPVHEYSSPAALLDALEFGICGCVVANVELSGMSALELLKALEPERYRLALILLTHDMDIPEAVAAMRAGVHDLLPLPVVERNLRQRVRTAMCEVSKNLKKRV